jgi:hypothetical protein
MVGPHGYTLMMAKLRQTGLKVAPDPASRWPLMSDEEPTDPLLFSAAFATLKKLPVQGFDYGSLTQRFKLMTLLLGEDYPVLLRGPALTEYPPDLARKLKLLGGPHGKVWAALRLREAGYRLSGGVWRTGADDGT